MDNANNGSACHQQHCHFDRIAHTDAMGMTIASSYHGNLLEGNAYGRPEGKCYKTSLDHQHLHQPLHL